MISLLLFIILILGCYSLYLSLTRNFNYWKIRNVKGPKPVPVFGNISDIALLIRTQAECLQKIYREYNGEKYVGMFQLSKPTLLLREPRLIKQFLIKDFQHFTDRGFIYDEKKEPLTANLVNLEGVKWRILRKKLTPTFSSGKIKNMMSLLQECSEQLLVYLDNIMHGYSIREIEMREFTAKFTTDVIGTCAFGLQFNSMSDDSSDFRRMGQKVMTPTAISSISKLIRIFFPSVFKILNLRTFPKEVNDFFLSVVSDTLQYRKLHDTYREDFLHMLAEVRGDKSVDIEADQGKEIEFTDNVIAAQAFAFFVAGFETSSTTLSFCLYELALNKLIQDELFLEIKQIMHIYKKPLTYESLKNLDLLERCLLETMRKYPPVQALARVCTKAYEIPNSRIHLDEGTALLIPVYAIHHDANIYENPEKFDPQRFMKEHINKRESGTYLPFGDGPRICIGMRFAMMEMKLALATLLHKYEVGPCQRTKNPLPLDPAAFILAPKGGIWLKIVERNSTK